MKSSTKKIATIFILTLACCGTFSAQSGQVTFQGSLSNGGSVANGNYDFEFVLFDSLNAGNQVGVVQQRNNVAVANGTFAVRLDFATSFPGAPRYLEIRVKPAGQPGITILAPRQPVDSSPYAIKSLNADSATTATNATQLGGVAANQFVVTTDPRMSDSRTPTAGSASYVQNSASPQAGSNFNISGNGTVGGTLSANIVNAATQYRIGGVTVLSIPGLAANTVVGTNAGGDISTGTFNTFVGASAGAANTSGASNSFFGGHAGLNITTGTANSFFGSSAGAQNTTGENNAFFGSSAGSQGSTGSNNSFFGWRAGRLNSGSDNAFFGYASGDANTNGLSNAFFGANSGTSNTTGDLNSFFGRSAGSANTAGNSNSFFGNGAGFTNTTGDHNTAIGDGANVASGDLSYATAIGSDAVVSTSNTMVLGRTEDIVRIPGFLRVVQLGSPGSTSLCQNVNDTISTCSSSIRYKSNINGFSEGLSLIDRLRPVSFNWKDGGMLDLGLVAEEVAKVEPLLVTTNNRGEIEGVKYDRVGVVLVNAVKEQQAQIEAQTETIRRQQLQIDALTKLVCATNASAEICGKKMRKEK